MVAQIQSTMDRSIAASLMRHKLRLVHRDTGDFLHMFGAGTTRSEVWAWSGFRYQAEALADQARIRGEEWPFVTVSAESDRPGFAIPAEGTRP